MDVENVANVYFWDTLLILCYTGMCRCTQITSFVLSGVWNVIQVVFSTAGSCGARVLLDVHYSGYGLANILFSSPQKTFNFTACGNIFRYRDQSPINISLNFMNFISWLCKASWRAGERESLLHRQHMLQQAATDAELAMSVMQSNLLESGAACREAQQQARSVQQSADIMRGDLEQAVRILHHITSAPFLAEISVRSPQSFLILFNCENSSTAYYLYTCKRLQKSGAM